MEGAIGETTEMMIEVTYCSSSGARNANYDAYRDSNMRHSDRRDNSERNGQDQRYRFPTRRMDRNESGIRRDSNFN